MRLPQHIGHRRLTCLVVLLAAPASALLVGKRRSPVRRRTQRSAILTEGEPLAWADSLEHLAYVREHGVTQFINAYAESQHLERNDGLLWGKEQ
jgi:hypothetical protein